MTLAWTLSPSVQAHLEGVQAGRQELHQMRLLNQKLERALSGRASEQQAAAEKETAAAVQAAAHAARLEHHVAQLKVRPTVQLDCFLRTVNMRSDTCGTSVHAADLVWCSEHYEKMLL